MQAAVSIFDLFLIPKDSVPLDQLDSDDANASSVVVEAQDGADTTQHSVPVLRGTINADRSFEAHTGTSQFPVLVSSCTPLGEEELEDR